MMPRSFLFVSALTLGAVAALGAVIGANVAALPLTEDRIAALPAAQQPAWRKYLSRSAAQMQNDRAALQTEMKKAGLSAPLIPPSASAAKSIPLDKPAAWYAGAEARLIADIVVSFQTPAGGWSKNLNLTDHARRLGEHFAGDNSSPVPGTADFDAAKDAKWEYVGTLDNDATTTEIRFLAKVAAGGSGKEAEVWRSSFLRGIQYLLAAQYPNGGWPQIWPLQGGYHDAITFNDDAMTKTMDVLLDAANGAAEFAPVPVDMRTRAKAAVTKDHSRDADLSDGPAHCLGSAVRHAGPQTRRCAELRAALPLQW
jgi:hypothetical protein